MAHGGRVARRPRKPKDRSAVCDSCGEHVPNPCAVRTTVMLCQKDAKALMIEGAYLEVKVVVVAPKAPEASDAEAHPARATKDTEA